MNASLVSEPESIDATGSASADRRHALADFGELSRVEPVAHIGQCSPLHIPGAPAGFSEGDTPAGPTWHHSRKGTGFSQGDKLLRGRGSRVESRGPEDECARLAHRDRLLADG
jgi:hypothetical protein